MSSSNNKFTKSELNAYKQAGYSVSEDLNISGKKRFSKKSKEEETSEEDIIDRYIESDNCEFFDKVIYIQNNQDKFNFDYEVWQPTLRKAKELEGLLVSRSTANTSCGRLYSNQAGLTSKIDGETKFLDYLNKSSLNLTLNVVKNCVDAVCAKISKNKTTVRFITENADFETQEKAKLASQYIDGIFHSTDFYNKAKLAFRDCTIYDIGVLQAFYNKEKEKLEIIRVVPDDILVDKTDSFNNDPTYLFKTSQVLASELMKQYPKYFEEINSASKNKRCTVYEVWVKNKFYQKIIDGAQLEFEVYEEDFFPFVFFRWNAELNGFYGVSLTQDLKEIQEKISNLLNVIDQGLEGAIPRIFIDSQTTVNTEQITDQIWSIINFSGKEPIFAPTAAFSGEVYNYLWQLVNKAYEISGISQLSAAGQKPSGIDAAVALRELQDIETQRFANQAQCWEDGITKIAEILIHLISTKKVPSKAIISKVIKDKTLKSIDWFNDIGFNDNNSFIIKAYPVSSLPNTPSGKLQFIQELTQNGFIQSKSTALSLLNLLDLEEFMDLENAPIENVKRIISLIIKKQIYTAPNKFMDLENGIRLVQQTLLKCQLDESLNVSEDVILMLQTWIDDAEAVLNPKQPPAPAAAGQPMADPAAAMPPAMPMAASAANAMPPEAAVQQPLM